MVFWVVILWWYVFGQAFQTDNSGINGKLGIFKNDHIGINGKLNISFCVMFYDDSLGFCFTIFCLGPYQYVDVYCSWCIMESWCVTLFCLVQEIFCFLKNFSWENALSWLGCEGQLELWDILIVEGRGQSWSAAGLQAGTMSESHDDRQDILYVVILWYWGWQLRVLANRTVGNIYRYVNVSSSAYCLSVRAGLVKWWSGILIKIGPKGLSYCLY